MAKAIFSKDGVEFTETPDSPEFVEAAKAKGYKRYYDVTKDDKEVTTVPEELLETSKSKGYRLFGQPKEEPSWLGRAAESAVETVKGAPAGLYQLGKEVVTQPGEATMAAIRGTGMTFGLQKPAGVLAGVVEAGKALVSGEEVGSAYERGRQAEEERATKAAEESKRISPAAYGAGPYVAATVGTLATGGGALPLLATETATGAAQQLAETGKIDTAELAGQTIGGAVVGKIAESAPTVAKKLLTDTAAEKAAKLERKAVAKAEETAALGDVAEQYTGPGGAEKIRAAKRAGFEAEAAKTKYKQVKAELDNEFNSRSQDIQQRNAKLENEYTTLRAQRAAEYNDLIKQFDAERQRVGGANEQAMADYNARLEAHNMETQRLQQQYNDARQKFEIEKADLDTKTQQKAKQVDEEYLGKKQQYDVEFSQWQEKTQQQKANNAIIAQENKLKTAEYRANVQKNLSDYKNAARELKNRAVQKAKESSRLLTGEAITAMGDELRGMLDNMDNIQNEVYETRRQVSASDSNIIDHVDNSVTSQAINDVERSLASGYMLDEGMREKFKELKMKVNPDLNQQSVTHGIDFETTLELRQYLDNLKNDLDNQAKVAFNEGKSVPKELTEKRQIIYDARKQVQNRLYGEQSPFSQELKTAGESADSIYAEFRNAKGLLQRSDVLAREKSVPGMKRGLEPRTDLIRGYFDELDAGRKAETRQLLQDLGVNVERLDLLEKQVRKGVIPEEIAMDQLKEQFKLPERPTYIPPSPLAPKPTAPIRPLPSAYAVEGPTPMKPMKPVMPAKPTRPMLQPVPSKPVFEAPPKPAYEAVPGKRILTPEEMQSRGYIAEQEGLAQEFEALGGKTTYPSTKVPMTQRGVFEKGAEWALGKVGIGQTPMQMLERAAQVRMTPTMLERVRQAFPESPRLTAALTALSNQGKVLTPAVVRAVARSHGIAEERLAEVLAKTPAP